MTTAQELLGRGALIEALGLDGPADITRAIRDGMPIAQKGGRGRPHLFDVGACREWLGLPAPDIIETEAQIEDGIEEPLVTRQQLAEILGVHPGTIGNWIIEGMPVAVRREGGNGPNRFRASECRAWQLAREEARIGDLDLTQERARKEHAMALLAEQKYKVLQGSLLDAADVRQTWAAELGAIRTRLMQIPVTAAASIHRAGATRGEAGTEDALDSEMRRVLTELSDPERDRDLEDEAEA